MAAKAGTDSTPPMGHNSPPVPLTLEEREALFHRHKKQAKDDNAAMEKAMEVVRGIRKKRNQNRNLCRSDGFPLKHLDTILELEGRAAHENAADAEIRTMMFRASRLPVTGAEDEQLELAFTPQTTNGTDSLDADDATWGGYGYSAGLRGDDGDPKAHDVPPERLQAWMAGWQEGQAKLMANLTTAKAIEKRRKADA